MVLGLAPSRDLAGWSRLRRTMLHAAGLVLGASMTGALLGWLGERLVPFPPAVTVTAAALIAAAYALTDVGVGLPLPRVGRHWQVPRRWLATLPAEVAYSLFGFLLGVGALTVVPYGIFTAFLAIEFLSANVVVGALLGLTYGLGRATSTVWETLVAGPTPTSQVPAIMARVPQWKRVLALTVPSCVLASSLVVIAGPA